MATRVVPVGGTIGIMGGGQLGRMMALAGRAMGLNTVVWDPAPYGPAQEAAGRVIAAPFDSISALLEFRDQIDCATYEFENVDYATTLKLEETCPVFPPPELLYVSQNRIREKDRARQLGLHTTPYQGVTTREQVRAAARELGVPGILKTVTGGYDGKGQYRLASLADGDEGFDQLRGNAPLIYEKTVDFTREISVVVARDQAGTVVTFPVAENHHHQGVLDWTVVPARVSAEAQRNAIEAARGLADGLQLVGVTTLEFFVTANDQVLFNEMAPRPHNSGHWTIEGAWPSQFTQHMRAVAGWAVTQPRQLSPAVMVNLLGDLFLDGLERLPGVLTMPGVQFHWYGKTEMRKGRKVGHLTVLGNSVDEALNGARQAKLALGGEWHDGT